MRFRPALVAFLLFAVVGFVFCAVSTYDFVQHLDRQTHALSCSIIPGLGRDATGTSGCHAALMSPYSSVLRAWVWGGIPSVLAGMAVFAFLAYRGIRYGLLGGAGRAEARALLLGALVPLATSIVYAGIAVFELGELCKVCLGIYGSSLGVFLAAVVIAWKAEVAEGDRPWSAAPRAGVEVSAFVVVPVLLYVVLSPDFSSYIGSCGTLEHPSDPSRIHVSVGGVAGGTPAVELLDPLCPACAAFEERLVGSGLGAMLDRKAVLFPLDNTCNWMVGSTVHPGACVVSEAVLCAGDAARDVLAWAFVHGEEIRSATSADPEAAKRMVIAAFPAVDGCVGTDRSRQRLNKSLRWAVQNQLPIVTPQLYVAGRKLCDEDTDLGLDWALPRLIAASEAP